MYMIFFFFFSGGIANLDKNNSSFLVLAKYLSSLNHWYLLENSPCLQKSSGKCDFFPLFSSTFRILFPYIFIHQTATRETPSPGSLNRARQTPLLGQRYDEHVSEWASAWGHSCLSLFTLLWVWKFCLPPNSPCCGYGSSTCLPSLEPPSCLLFLKHSQEAPR